MPRSVGWGLEIHRVHLRRWSVESAGGSFFLACFFGFLHFGAEGACFGVFVVVGVEIADPVTEVGGASVGEAEFGVVVDVCPLVAVFLDASEEGIIFVSGPGVAFAALAGCYGGLRLGL